MPFDANRTRDLAFGTLAFYEEDKADRLEPILQKLTELSYSNMMEITQLRNNLNTDEAKSFLSNPLRAWVFMVSVLRRIFFPVYWYMAYNRSRWRVIVKCILQRCFRHLQVQGRRDSVLWFFLSRLHGARILLCIQRTVHRFRQHRVFISIVKSPIWLMINSHTKDSSHHIQRSLRNGQKVVTFL